MRIENELYLRNHPEIKDILGYFMNQVLLKHPENIIETSVGKFIFL